MGTFRYSTAPQREISLDSVIEQLPSNSKYWWSQDRVEKLKAQMSAQHTETLNKMIAGEIVSYGTVYRRMRSGESRAELRVDGLAGCLRTPRGGSSKQILVQAGQNNLSIRLMTPREYARLQGVSDSFVLPEKDVDGYFAMGDAVCVPLITWLSKNILTPCYQSWFTTQYDKTA